MKNKYVSFTFFTTFGIKAAEQQTGKINITVEGKKIEIDGLGVSKTENNDDILQNIQKDIQKQIPLYLSENYFISELKINNNPVDISDGDNIKIEKDQKADIVLKKKLKVKEIKFKDSNFKQYLKNDFYFNITNNIDENKDFTYKTIFDTIKSILNLFKTDQFGIKLNNLEDTNETPYNGTDKLNEGDEITVILDENKIEEKAFSKFVFEYDEDIYNIENLRRDLDNKIENKDNDTITNVFSDYLFKEKDEGSNQKVEFDVFKNDDNTPIKCNSNEKIPNDLKYFRMKLTKNILQDFLIKKDYKVQLAKKGCKIVNEDVLKSIEITINRSLNGNLLECFKESIFINEKIDKNMISIKNQDTSDTKKYTLDDAELPQRIIIDLIPEAFIANQVKVVFEIKDVEKDGRNLKIGFKNKFKEDGFHLTYGDNKSVLISLITGIIPGITEADIKLNGQPLPNEIKEGGKISIPVEKIPDENFEDKSKSEEEQQNNGNKGNNGNGNNNGNENGDNNGDNNKKNGGCCGSNKK